MIQKFWEFAQPTESTTWNVNNVPENSVRAVITHVVTSDGQVLQPDSQLISPNGLQLSFGVTPISGVAYGEYFLDSDGDGVPDSSEHNIVTDGSVVNITINQYPKAKLESQ